MLIFRRSKILVKTAACIQSFGLYFEFIDAKISAKFKFVNVSTTQVPQISHQTVAVIYLYKEMTEFSSMWEEAFFLLRSSSDLHLRSLE